MSVEENEISDEEVLASLEDKPEEGTEEAQATDGGVTEESGFAFKSLDELMGHELSYKANGKDVSEPLSAILKRASQGYNYAQAMGELNSQKSEWQKKLEESEGMRSKYSEIDEYAKQNPEWFDHWNNAYQNRGQQQADSTGAQQGFDPNQITQLVQQELSPIKETVQQYQERLEQERVQQENAELDKQIQSTQKEFTDVDFTHTDPDTGLSLEHKVYQFMVDNNIQDFNKAYKMMDYDNIVSRMQQKAKEDFVKQEQKKRKEGIVSETTGEAKTPQAPDLSRLNPDQVENLQLQELERLRGGAL